MMDGERLAASSRRARSRSRLWRSCADARSTTRSSSSTRRRTPRPEQMKMFLTRLGFGSKMVVTGDVTQIDLPGGRQSGLVTVARGADGDRRHRLRPLRQPRRRAPQARAAHRGRLQGARRPRGERAGERLRRAGGQSKRRRGARGRRAVNAALVEVVNRHARGASTRPPWRRSCAAVLAAEGRGRRRARRALRRRARACARSIASIAVIDESPTC